MNVLLLTVDCLRHDRVGYASGRKDLTPNIDRLSRRSTVFTQAIAGGPETAASVPVLLSSAYPKSVGRGWRNKVLFESRPTIAALLKAQGFAAGGFHTNPNLSRHFGYGAEYDVYEDNLMPGTVRSRSKAVMWLHRVRRLVSPCLPADKLTGQAIDWIRTLKGPFFAWIHYMDAHSPYHAGEGMLAALRYLTTWRIYHKSQEQPEKLTGRERDRLVKAYEQGVRFVDASLGTLEAELHNLGLLEDTAIILTADHGEAFGEHGKYGHGRYLYDETLRVPLLIHWPGQNTVPRVEGQVELTTILPTVLEMLHLPIPEHAVGRSAVPWLLGQAAPSEPVNVEAISRGHVREDFVNLSVRTSEWKYILRHIEARGVQESELYHLVADPEEKKECSRQYPEVVDQLHERAQSHIRSVLETELATEEAADLPEEVVDRLRALGYMG